MMFDRTSPLDRTTLLEIFDYLNERLKENQLQLEMTVYGGSIMTMVYDNRPATKDINCIFSEANNKLLNHVLELTGRAFGLPAGWINDDINEPLSALLREDKEVHRCYSNLTILKPRAEQLLAMKILAARPEPAKDFVDAYLLCKDLGITSRELLLKTIRVYVPVKLLGERQLNFIRDLGEDLGYDW